MAPRGPRGPRQRGRRISRRPRGRHHADAGTRRGARSPPDGHRRGREDPWALLTPDGPPTGSVERHIYRDTFRISMAVEADILIPIFQLVAILLSAKQIGRRRVGEEG